MSKHSLLAVAALLAASAALLAQGKYKVGRAATPEDIRKFDTWAAPSGTGLPAGKGTAAEGREIFKRRCERCHGDAGQGGDADRLVGGQGTLTTPKPLKTVGSYWPHSTTLWDYINRAMPFLQPGVLTNDQVYSLTALILHWNGIIGESDVMNAETLPKVKMPNSDGFIADSRPDTGARKKR